MGKIGKIQKEKSITLVSMPSVSQLTYFQYFNWDYCPILYLTIYLRYYDLYYKMSL